MEKKGICPPPLREATSQQKDVGKQCGPMLTSVASVYWLSVPYLDGLGVLTATFWPSFRRRNISKLLVLGVFAL